jgi:hypothetical protein
MMSVNVLRQGSMMLATLSFALSCEVPFDCDKENLLIVQTPSVVESLEVRDEKDRTLWKLAAIAPAKVSSIRYGEIPRGYQQTFPSGSIRPRDFVGNEQLSVITITPERNFLRMGNAMGARTFCGAYNHSAARKPGQSHGT